MGKARIVSGGEDGYYTVEVLYNRVRIDAEIESLNAQIEELVARRNALQAEYDEAVIERNVAAAAVDEKVAAYIAGGSEGVLNVEAELIALAQASAKVQMIDVDLAMAKGRILKAQKRRELLQSLPADDVQPAWCADYTEDLTGDVGTIELPGEGRTRMIIRPGYTDAATYTRNRDGQLHFREGQAGYQAYFNAAILPGWQKWRPLHRVGVIGSINEGADACDLTIQSETSSANNLVIDQGLSLVNVPIQYMNCDSLAFEVGDRVLVEFQEQNWDKPRVIGFEKEPKMCLPRYLALPIFADQVPEYIPMPTYNSDNETIDEYRYYRGGKLYLTGFSGIGIDRYSYIDYTVPPGYDPNNVDHDGGLIVYWNDLTFRWQDAIGYGGIVGADPWGGALTVAQEFTAGKYIASKTGLSTFIGEADPVVSFIDRLNGIWLRSIDTNTRGILLPNAGAVDPIHEGLDLQALYRFDVNAWLALVDSLSGPTLRVHGDYLWEKLASDPDEIFADHLSAPATLTVPVAPGSSRTVTYDRQRVGWRPHATVNGYRQLAAVYTLDGEVPPTYAAGFWAE